MFKGIISQIGVIDSIAMTSNSTKRVLIKSKSDDLFKNLDVGSSVSCSGICLTIIEILCYKNNVKSHIIVDLSQETLSVSNAKFWSVSSEINLENSIIIGDTLDGHFVQGHVDATVEILSIISMGNCYNIEFSYPKEDDCAKYIVKKGSIALDGVSLTVNKVFEDRFSVSIIPYTWHNTIFLYSKVGDLVNLETDMIARYLAKILNR